MIIDKISPKFVGDKTPLNKCLADEGKNRGITSQEIDLLLSSIPLKILNVDCFFDKLTKKWRYEFGLPFTVGNGQYLYGTHMWPPIEYLFSVLFSAIHKLPDRKQREYFSKLTNIDKHWDTLVEFLPIIRLSENTAFSYEVSTGVGNLNADWGITSNCGRMILIDVKRRFRDLLEVVDRIENGEQDPDGTAPAPTHDVGLMFRSIESKFAQNDPAQQLQGAWIETALKQEETELQNSFSTLDGSRVHFAIFGGWKPGVKLLTKRPEDKKFLLDLFNESIGDNFH
ncbi:MAG: hypothetical protein LWX02_04455, partial [Deltaproteobacteria bacterium]|nr:hypothetical protein [Deltaproteobacteria bacterium]MDL1987854.1 hypothetical protein [Deltaproteobacteria bacterium]